MEQTAVAGFANLGRPGEPEPIVEAMEKITKQMPAGTVMMFNEIEEGDRGYDERALMRQIMSKRWVITHPMRHEPILVPHHVDVYGVQSFPAADGVEHESPARRIQQTIVVMPTGPDVAYLTGHFPAGAYNGDRPGRVKVELVRQWKKMVKELRRLIRANLKAGRHVIWAMDTNRRDMPKLHRREVEVIKHGPDHIRVIPAKRYTVNRLASDVIPLPVEALHPALWARVQFVS